MPTLLDEPFSLCNYLEYEPVIQYVLDFLLRAKGERGNILNFVSEIDGIMSNLFNVNSTYARKLRNFYSPNSKKQNYSNAGKKCLHDIKISHFNFKQLMPECNAWDINIPDDTFNEILFLSTCALPVSEILNEKSRFEIHAKFKCTAKTLLSEIDEIMKNNLDLKASMFMYLHQFRSEELIWWLLATLPSISKTKISQWISSFGDVPSDKAVLQLEMDKSRTSYLLDFSNKFNRFNIKNLKNVYAYISGVDLLLAYRHLDCFRQLSVTSLRPEDIYLTYLIVTTIKSELQSLILEQIASESKANLSVEFRPINEVQVDWKTRTAQ